MTRLTVPGQLDLEYRFSATANDGKAISQKNYISGEELEYLDDTLGRLPRAETTANSGQPRWCSPVGSIHVSGNEKARISKAGRGHDSRQEPSGPTQN